MQAITWNDYTFGVYPKVNETSNGTIDRRGNPFMSFFIWNHFYWINLFKTYDSFNEIKTLFILNDNQEIAYLPSISIACLVYLV